MPHAIERMDLAGNFYLILNFHININSNQTKYIKCYNYYYKLNKTNVVDLDNVFIKVIELLNKIFKITCIRIL